MTQALKRQILNKELKLKRLHNDRWNAVLVIAPNLS